MAELTLYYRLLGKLRRLPALYALLRKAARWATQLPVDLLRQLPSSAGLTVARGFFSGVAQVRAGEVRGRVVFEEQSCPPYPADSLVKLSRLGQDEHQPWPFFWSHHPNARLIGTSLALMDERQRLCAESTFSRTGARDDPAYWSVVCSAPERLSGPVTSVISRWGYLGYWHWLMDSLPRLAVLAEFPPETRILVPSSLSGWARWFLEAFDVADRCIPTAARHLLVEDYFFASPSAMTGCFNPSAVQFLREHFLPRRAARSEGPRRFYIVREGFTRGVRNEREVREFFAARGWGLIAPETLSIPEQIALFAEAEFVAGIHGSALTNVVWCQPGCRVLDFTPDNFFTGAFEILTDLVGGRHGFLLCPADPEHHIHVDLGRLARKLDSMEG